MVAFLVYDMLKGIYNRLSLIIGLIFDIDMALYRICLPWEVKYNKSWGTIFAIKYFFHT